LDDEEKVVRCGDVISAGELETLGIDATGFEPDVTGKPGRGGACLHADVGFMLFPGRDYGSMIRGSEANADRSGIEPVDGASVGGSSRWGKMHTVYSVMFQSENQRYAGHLTGSDQALLEKLAGVLAANMQKR
jgi:hypothetical protein